MGSVKVPLHIVLARRERLAQMIEQHRYLPVKELCRRLEVSEATLRRDLAALVQEKKITRTYGGALSEFNDRFPSFRERQSQGAKAKAKIAAAALAFFEPGKTYFFDSGTTIYAIAEAFRDHPVVPVTIVTSNLPVGEILASIPGVQVFQLAGQLLHLQSTLLGETAQKSLEFWRFDVAFLSAEGMDREGIWNSQAAIVEQQKVLISRTGRSVFCLDGAKLRQRAPHFLLAWPEVDFLLTDLSGEKLKGAGIELQERQLHPKSGKRLPAPASQSSPPDSTGETPSNDFPVHIL
jgi:DeoR/GlpR family transcriptional regulator of sugar metabolism